MSKNDPSKKVRVAVYIRIGGTGEYAMNLDVQRRHYTELIDKNLIGSRSVYMPTLERTAEGNQI